MCNRDGFITEFVRNKMNIIKNLDKAGIEKDISTIYQWITKLNDSLWKKSWISYANDLLEWYFQIYVNKLDIAVPIDKIPLLSHIKQSPLNPENRTFNTEMPSSNKSIIVLSKKSITRLIHTLKKNPLSTYPKTLSQTRN
jgi:hypothetical protein